MKGIMMVLITVLSFPIYAQGIVGDWNGKLSFQGMELSVVFHVTSQDGKYQTTMDSPDQGVAGIPVDETTFENGKLTIKAIALQMEYTAELNEEGDTLKGSFNQNGMSFDLRMTKE